MRLYVTQEFYDLCNAVYANPNLSLAKVQTFRKLRAFSFKYKVLSPKQFEVMADIAASVGIDLSGTVEVEHLSEVH